MTSRRAAREDVGGFEDQNPGREREACGDDGGLLEEGPTLPGDQSIDLRRTLPRLHDLLLMLRTLKQKRADAPQEPVERE